MLVRVYVILLVYFLIGAVAIFFINKKNNAPKQNKERWLKYAVYFFIVNGIVLSTQHAVAFKCIAAGILLLAVYEIVTVFTAPKIHKQWYLFLALMVMCIAGAGFWYYAGMPAYNKLYVYLLVFVFDGFCQICGQLFGRHKLSPRISPNKTVEGLLGGGIITVATCLMFAAYIGYSYVQVSVVSVLLCIAALTGDLAASFYKRLCNVKDYSRLIPGHGGILDRFDSFIFAGAAYYVITLLY